MYNKQKPFVIVDVDTAAHRKVAISNPSWAPDIVRVELADLTILHLSWEDAERLADQLWAAASHAEHAKPGIVEHAKPEIRKIQPDDVSSS